MNIKQVNITIGLVIMLLPCFALNQILLSITYAFHYSLSFPDNHRKECIDQNDTDNSNEICVGALQQREVEKLNASCVTILCILLFLIICFVYKLNSNGLLPREDFTPSAH